MKAQLRQAEADADAAEDALKQKKLVSQEMGLREQVKLAEAEGGLDAQKERDQIGARKEAAMQKIAFDLVPQMNERTAAYEEEKHGLEQRLATAGGASEEEQAALRGGLAELEQTQRVEPGLSAVGHTRVFLKSACVVQLEEARSAALLKDPSLKGSSLPAAGFPGSPAPAAQRPSPSSSLSPPQL